MKGLQETCILFGKTCVTPRPAQKLTGKCLDENLQRKCKKKNAKQWKHPISCNFARRFINSCTTEKTKTYKNFR